MDSEHELLYHDPSGEDEDDLGSFRPQAVVTSTDWTTETILAQLRRGNIELSPSFQRREAWNDNRKSSFIESLFLGLPVPQLVLAERPDRRGAYIVIDGKQRLLSIRRFGVEESGEDFEPLRLRGLKTRQDLNHHTWASLKDVPEFQDDKAAYENQTIRTVVVRNWRDDAFLYLVFLRLNTGSVPLSPQELRQALHPGPFTDFVEHYSSESQSIRKALRLRKPDFRMRDVELLIRFFAFAEFLDRYNGNLKAFLDSTSEHFNNHWGTRQSDVNEIASQCDQAIDRTMSIFGEDAFRLWQAPDGFERRFNRAVFDIMTYYFRNHQEGELAVCKKQGVREAYKELCESDGGFIEALQTTTKSVPATFNRLRKWGFKLETVLGCQLQIPEFPQLVKRIKIRDGALDEIS